MTPFLRRILAYGLAAPLAAGLVHFGFFYELPPDPEHAVLQAEIKLRFASRLPPQRPDGSLVAARAELIADAVRFLDEAEQLAPPTATTVEYRAYVDYLRGDARAAAANYSRASALAGERAASDMLALSAARMLALAGDDASAMAAIEARQPLAPEVVAAAELERARILHRQDRSAEAATAARAVAGDREAKPDVLLGAGEVLELCGDDAMACTAYERASASSPLGSYLLARLKARMGEVDNALKMLEDAVSGGGTTVRALVERDFAAWQPCLGTERFRRLFPDLEAARPGR